MSTRRVVTLTDDINGREGAETVTFSYAGRSYEIDLGEKNRAKLEKALEPFIAAARKASGPTRRSGSKASGPPSSVDRDAVRAWASEQGLKVATRGRLAASVLESFRQAH